MVVVDLMGITPDSRTYVGLSMECATILYSRLVCDINCRNIVRLNVACRRVRKCATRGKRAMCVRGGSERMAGAQEMAC